MSLKHYKPTSSGRRLMTSLVYRGVSRKPVGPKHLRFSKAKSGGRNQHGKITVRHIGGGHKKTIRDLDSRREKFNIPARVAAIEYDPNRSAFLALLNYADGEKRYILAPNEVKVGDTFVSSAEKVEVRPGNRTKLRFLPAGTFVHDIEFFPGGGGQIVRGGGNYATIMAAEGEYATLRLPSGETRRFLMDCMGTIGQLSNIDHFNVRVGKAGRKRYMGIRPSVRGKAMNPVDHPHGGGEGRNPIGMKYPKTPWGKHALGVKTRGKHKASNKFIIHRRK